MLERKPNAFCTLRNKHDEWLNEYIIDNDNRNQYLKSGDGFSNNGLNYV